MVEDGLVETEKAGPGLDRLLASLAPDADRAPVLATIGFEAVEYGLGRAVFALTPAERHFNNVDTVHGGILATLLDSAMSCAVFSALGPGLTSSTTSLSIGFVRPVTPQSGLLRCEGELLRLGRRNGHATGRLLDADGRLCAYGSAICAVSAL